MARDRDGILEQVIAALAERAAAGDATAQEFMDWLERFNARYNTTRDHYQATLDAAMRGDKTALDLLADRARLFLEAANDHA